VKLRRVAVGLVASAATVLAALPAHAATTAATAHRHVTAHQAPAQHHRDAVKRTPATASTTSKRDGGHAAIPAPAPAASPGTGFAVRLAVSFAVPAHWVAAAAARAPPAGQ
jgi:hypothetical protein